MGAIKKRGLRIAGFLRQNKVTSAELRRLERFYKRSPRQLSFFKTGLKDQKTFKKYAIQDSKKLYKRLNIENLNQGTQSFRNYHLGVNLASGAVGSVFGSVIYKHSQDRKRRRYYRTVQRRRNQRRGYRA